MHRPARRGARHDRFHCAGLDAVAATMPGSRAAAYGWNVREPWKEGDQTPARMPCQARKREAWACPAKRVSAKRGRADGSSACPGGSPFEPGGVSTKATIPGDMQQTAKSIRVRNAGDKLRQRPVRPAGLDHCPCAKSMRDARIVTVRAPRARVFAQPFRTPLSGKRNKDKPACPGAG